MNGYGRTVSSSAGVRAWVPKTGGRSGPAAVNDREAAMRLLEAIRHSDGVVDLRDRLSYPRDDEPASAPSHAPGR